MAVRWFLLAKIVEMCLEKCCRESMTELCFAKTCLSWSQLRLMDYLKRCQFAMSPKLSCWIFIIMGSVWWIVYANLVHYTNGVLFRVCASVGCIVVSNCVLYNYVRMIVSVWLYVCKYNMYIVYKIVRLLAVTFRSNAYYCIYWWTWY